MATLFTADVASSYAAAKGVRNLTPGPVNPDLDITFDCLDYDDEGNYGQGIATAIALVYGSKPFIDFVATATAGANASGSMILGNVFDATVTAYALAYADLILEKLKTNWVSWSNIGEVNFAIGRDNVAGRRPFDWTGW